MTFGDFPGKVRSTETMPPDDLEVTEAKVYALDDESVITLVNKTVWSAAFVRFPSFTVLIVVEKELC
jgi:hypothetical protein